MKRITEEEIAEYLKSLESDREEQAQFTRAVRQSAEKAGSKRQ